MNTPSESTLPENRKSIKEIAEDFFLIVITIGVFCAFAFLVFSSHITRKSNNLPTQVKQVLKTEPLTTTPPHTRVSDLASTENLHVLIGHKFNDQVLLDASSLCIQPDFRYYSIRDANVKIDESSNNYITQAMDIQLPNRLVAAIWTIVSTEATPTTIISNAAYQWLDMGNLLSHCLFVGPTYKEQQRYFPFDIGETVPVIAVHGAPIPDDKLRLVKQTEVIELPALTLDFAGQWYPWLKEYQASPFFGCASNEFELTELQMTKVQAQFSRNEKTSDHWLVSSNCEGFTTKWALIVSQPNGRFDIVGLERSINAYDYFPSQIWISDIDSDGIDEIITKAQYYEGFSHAVLKLTQNKENLLILRELVESTYVGL